MIEQLVMQTLKQLKVIECITFVRVGPITSKFASMSRRLSSRAPAAPICPDKDPKWADLHESSCCGRDTMLRQLMLYKHAGTKGIHVKTGATRDEHVGHMHQRNVRNNNVRADACS